MKIFWIKTFVKPLPIESGQTYHEILAIHSSYYQKLNPSLQERFRHRLYQLLRLMEFTSREIPHITAEMQVVMGCAIIEITFGLKKFLPSFFTEIRIMPRRYMYPGYGQPFLGHVDYSRGIIYLSWQDVQKGYAIPDDAVNVALHEMAHVLELENSYRKLFNKFFKRVSWNEWAEIAFEEMKAIRQNQSDFLKSYGGINMKEMFAICIETFFEQPQEFQAHLPELYQTMIALLNQDPLQAKNPLFIQV